MKFALGLSAAVLLFITSAQADTFGTGPDIFTIEFVNIGNAGNADDAAFDNTAPDFSAPYGGVAYEYRMGTYEIAQDVVQKARFGGLENVAAGAWQGLRPAANMTWYEAAAFVNWLNTTTGHQAAYQLNVANTALTLWSSGDAWQAGGENLYRHKDAYYFLPSEDEWYKAAYHQNDGVTANYWDYATGSNTIPTAVPTGTASGTAIYNGARFGPEEVHIAGGLSAYGTMAQNGNVYEWQESAFDGTNDTSSENRVIRGGYSSNAENALRSVSRITTAPTTASTTFGFRVASVPEPSSAVLVLGSGLVLLFRRGSRPRG